jgi:iron(III) transport system substrate-binding protein
MRTGFMRIAFAAAIFAASITAACRPGGEEAARRDCVAPTGERINIYTARHYDADLQLYDAFTCESGIEIRRLELSPDQLIARMEAEAELSAADVILMADAGALWRAQQAGLFQPVSTPTLEERIPAALHEPSGLWWGFSRRARVIAYDTERVDAADVATYADLADPKFAGGVCVRSSDNVYNLSLMAALIEHWGRERALEWARGVVANFARQPSGGDIDQIRAVGAGACKVALTNTYYYLRIATSENAGDVRTAQRVALAFPDIDGAGTHVNISGGGLAAHAPNPEGAIRFLEFLSGEEAQNIFAGANHEFPAVGGVEPPADVATIADFTADPIPVAVYGRRQSEAQGVFNEAGWR